MERDVTLDLPPEAQTTRDPVDFAFLARQTFDDLELQHEVLVLFLAQARRVLPSLPTLDAAAQGNAAHLLKGSARGIGAWPVAIAAEAYEAACSAERPAAFTRLSVALAEAAAAIETRLATQVVGRATI